MEAIADLMYDLPKNYGLAFDIVHYVVCLQAERADLGDGFEKVTRNNPLASWVSAMMVCFAGALLVNPLCGESPLEFLQDPLRLGIATVLWYLMFYSPRDLVYQTSKRFPVLLPLYAVKGLYYPKKILAGLKHAKHVLDKKNWLGGVAVATLKANGSGFIKPLARMARGSSGADCLESLKPSLTTKYCLVSALLYAFFPQDVTYVAIAGILVAMKVGPLFSLPVDIFAKIESKAVPLVFRKIDDEKKEN